MVGRRCLRLRGQALLENNGGFVQSALDLDATCWWVDASGFTGIRIVARGAGAAVSKPLDTRRLSRIGIVAANKAIAADVAVARVSLYR